MSDARLRIAFAEIADDHAQTPPRPTIVMALRDDEGTGRRYFLSPKIAERDLRPLLGKLHEDLHIDPASLAAHWHLDTNFLANRLARD